MMQYNTASYSHIQTGCLTSMLRDVDKVVTNVNLILIQAFPLIADYEQCVSSERVLLDRNGCFHDFDAAYGYVALGAVLSHIG